LQKLQLAYDLRALEYAIKYFSSKSIPGKGVKSLDFWIPRFPEFRLIAFKLNHNCKSLQLTSV